MEDNKLTEFEEKLIEAVLSACGQSEMYDRPHEDILLQELRKVVPPTCGLEQRKFLDEVEKLHYNHVFGLMFKDCVAIDSDVFISDLSKVIKGE